MIKLPMHMSKLANRVTVCCCFLSLVGSLASVRAQSPEVPEKTETNDEGAMTGLNRQDDVLLDHLFDSVSGLTKPRKWEDAIKVPIDVTTSNKTAREYARQGFGLMACGWDIEAHRSFVHALKYDPDCLTSYTGLLYLSATNHNPSHALKTGLMERVDALYKTREETEYVFNQQERLYAELAISRLEGEKDKQLEVLDKLVEQYPMDFQALISKKVLMRMRSGAVTVEEQQEKKDYLAMLMKRYKYTPMLWVYWMLLHDYETDQGVLASQVLPVVNKLTVWAPEMPTFTLKKGYFLRKAGQFKEADAEFIKAEKLYAGWGKESKIPDSANAGLWKTRIFMAVNYFDMGEFEKAIKLAKEMDAAEVNASYKSEMRGVFLWEVKTLLTRFYLARGDEGDLERAREALPTRDYKTSVEKFSAVTFYYQGLNEYIAIRILIRDGRMDDALKIQSRLSETLGKMNSQRKENSDGFIDKNYFFRGYGALQIYFDHSNALISLLNKDKKGYEALVEAARGKLDRYGNLTVLPRHVMQKF